VGPREDQKARTLEVERIVDLAWESLPLPHRKLLESIGASQRCVVEEPLGGAVDSFRLSAGLRGLSRQAKLRLVPAFGVWVQELGIVLVNAAHPALVGLSDVATERFVARLAWHEWGHALSVTRCSRDDVFAGRKLLARCPQGVREDIRSAGYGPQSYTHEVIAETYALLMERRVRGESGQPPWLDNEIYSVLKRVTVWTK
jgi:hypothetical protein